MLSLKTTRIAAIGLVGAMGAMWIFIERPSPSMTKSLENASHDRANQLGDHPDRSRRPVAIPMPRMEATTKEYEDAEDLEALAYSLRARSANGDERASIVLSRILEECAPLSANANYVGNFRKNALSLPEQQRRAAIAHIERFDRRCAGLVSSMQINRSTIEEVNRKWQDGDSPAAIAHRLANVPGAYSPEEAKSAAAKVMASRDGEAIFVMADAMAWMSADGSDLLPKYFGGAIDSVAWKMVGCSLGAPCSAASQFVRGQCIAIMSCVPGGFHEYARHYGLTPHQYALAIETEQKIMNEIDSGNLLNSFNNDTEMLK